MYGAVAALVYVLIVDHTNVGLGHQLPTKQATQRNYITF